MLINKIPSDAAKQKENDWVYFEVGCNGNYREDNNADIISEVV